MFRCFLIICFINIIIFIIVNNIFELCCVSLTNILLQYNILFINKNLHLFLNIHVNIHVTYITYKNP